MNIKKILLNLIILISLLLALASCSLNNSDNNLTDSNESEIDLSNIVFNDKTYLYDGSVKSIYIEGELPSSVEVEYFNNTRVDVGVSEASCLIKLKDEVLKTLKALITVVDPSTILDQLSFNSRVDIYDGKKHELLLDGQLPSYVRVEYLNNALTNVGYTEAEARIYDKYTNKLVRVFKASLTVKDNEEKIDYLSDLKLDYTKVGHGSLALDKDSNGNSLSLNIAGYEQEFSKGLFAHAYSTIVLENIGTKGYEQFSTYMGLNKTGRVSNSVANLKFLIYFDNNLVYESKIMNSTSEAEFVKLDVSNVDRITLVADSLGGNGNDHAVWADTKLSYHGCLGASIIATDLKFASPDKVLNILDFVKCYDENFNDITNTISYQTDFIEGSSGEFNIIFKSTYNNIVTTKKVKLVVLDEEKYRSYDLSDLQTPFANTLYYGYWLLSPENRKAYDFILTKLLKVDLSNPNVNTISIDLYDNGIYVFPEDMKRLKKYMAMDETRIYYTYYWKAGDYDSGVSYTLDGAFVKTITIDLYNRSNQYYYLQNYDDVLLQSEVDVAKFLNNLSYDMSAEQMAYAVQLAFQNNLTYANVNYGDSFYGAFITHQAICSGYARGLQYLMQRIGLRSAYDVGSAGGAHAWTLVNANSKWYMSDATWGLQLRGKEYFDSTGRYSNGPYHIMPTLNLERYDENLLKYPLIKVTNTNAFVENGDTTFNIESLFYIDFLASSKVEIVNVIIDGNFNINANGTYKLKVNVINSLGNISNFDINVVVGNSIDFNLRPISTEGKTNYNFQGINLYQDGKEVYYENGWFQKANGAYSLNFAIEGLDYNYFETYFGIEGEIRKGQYGFYANATFEFIIDGNLIYKVSNVGWKTNQQLARIEIPSGSKILTIKVTDNSGQGRAGFGNPKFFKV